MVQNSFSDSLLIQYLKIFGGNGFWQKGLTNWFDFTFPTRSCHYRIPNLGVNASNILEAISWTTPGDGRLKVDTKCHAHNKSIDKVVLSYSLTPSKSLHMGQSRSKMLFFEIIRHVYLKTTKILLFSKQNKTSPVTIKNISTKTI